MIDQLSSFEPPHWIPQSQALAQDHLAKTPSRSADSDVVFMTSSQELADLPAQEQSLTFQRRLIFISLTFQEDKIKYSDKPKED